MPDMVAHTFSPSTREPEAGGSLSSKPSVVYKVSSRIARATQRVPVLKKKREKEKKKVGPCVSPVGDLVGFAGQTSLCWMKRQQAGD